MPSVGNIAVLGSTGSIGQQTLQIVRDNPDTFNVVSIAANKNVDLIIKQAREFKPELVAVADLESAKTVQNELGSEFEVLAGEKSLVEAATNNSVHTVVAAVMGFAGLNSVIEGIKAGKHIALANKESLVAGGFIVQRELEKSSSKLVPVDSEHSSLFQCLLGQKDLSDINKLILTASGGPFLNSSLEELRSVGPEQALAHPRWDMGAKISIDSATMMNKGLELIEAKWLFDVEIERLDAIIHPQSLVHAIVEFVDGAMLASMGATDMRLPISYALSYLSSEDPKNNPGRRLNKGLPLLDLTNEECLEFRKVDHVKFPAVKLCLDALKGGSADTIILNAANEVAVDLFLEKNLSFQGITELVSRCLDVYDDSRQIESVDDIISVDAASRRLCLDLMNNFRE